MDGVTSWFGHGWGLDGAHGPWGHGIKTLCFRACTTHASKPMLGTPKTFYVLVSCYVLRLAMPMLGHA